MARTNALSIVDSSDVAEKLAESYGQVIETVQKGAVSERIKARNFSGDPLAGSVEFKRFVNSTVADYGTARTAGEGSAVKADPVIVNIDTDKEIVEEVEKKDVEMYGVDGMVERRRQDHANRMTAYLDRQFFEVADATTNVHTNTKTTIQDKLEELIQTLEVVENDYVDGVPREMMVITLKPTLYGEARNYLDTITRPTVDGGEESFQAFHGVRVESNARQTSNALIMIEGAIAQPVVADQYDAERIPLSNAVALELFFSKGTKAVTEDLIFKSTLADPE